MEVEENFSISFIQRFEAMFINVTDDQNDALFFKQKRTGVKPANIEESYINV